METENKNIKLTPKQNAVINLLQNGWVLVTGAEVTGAWVSNDKYQFHINNGLFFRLVDMELIYQAGEKEHFSFILTTKGKSIKTKVVSVDAMGLEELPTYKNGEIVPNSEKDVSELEHQSISSTFPTPTPEIKVVEEPISSYNYLYNALCDLSKSLSDEVIKINTGILKGDTGILDMKTDPMQTKSFSRGRTVGLVISRDRIDNIIQKVDEPQSPWTILELKDGKYTNAPEPERAVLAILRWGSGK